VIFFLTSAAIFIAPFWLPQGYFTSRWTAAYTALAIVAVAVFYVAVDFPRSHDLVNMLGISATIFGAWAQLHHYRHVDDVTARQQIKWVVIGIVFATSGFFVHIATSLAIGNRPELAARVTVLLTRMFLNVAQVSLPVCLAIAITRYRLWQVDLVINRSFVFGAVTISLLIAFLGSAAAVQAFVHDATVAGAVSFAVAGLLFNPAREHIQRLVDKRLFGLRFDLVELNRAQLRSRITDAGALTGRTLGDYEVLEVLGRGGMGEVYRAERDGRVFALKIIADGGDLAELQKWFRRESEALTRLSHPNIVRFHESGSSGNVHYLVLDFIDGRELSAVLNERRRLPVSEVRQYLEDIAAALDHAHVRGFVHRDIKPSNIMLRGNVDGSPQAVLMDFGVAKFRECMTALTSTGTVGTIQYMAPEQILASKSVDARADVYALGVTLYQSLTGELPFVGNAGQLVFSHLNQDAVDPRVLVPDLPVKAAVAVMKALEKNPEDRFQSAGELAAAFSDR
jgi:hypothetical protein